MKWKLPDGWKNIPLDLCVECLDSKRIPLNNEERMKMKGKIPYYGANGQVDTVNDYLFDEELLLLAEDGGSWGFKEKCSYIISGKSWVNNHAHVLRVRDNCDIQYLESVLNYADFNKYITGTTRGKLNKKNMMKINIPLPPLPVQKKIADILDQAAQLREWRREADKLTDEYLKSVFLDMFGDPVVNNKEWKQYSLKDISNKIQIGPFGSQLHRSDYIEDGIPLINPMHIINLKVIPDFSFSISYEKYIQLPNYHLKREDIIMARRGEMGRCALITEKGNGWFCGTGSLYIRPTNNVNSVYLLYALSGSSIKLYLERESRGITMKNLNKSILEKLRISIPPLSLQNKFAAIVEKVEKMKSKQMKSKIEIDNLFNSLMQRAFRGELVA